MWLAGDSRWSASITKGESRETFFCLVLPQDVGLLTADVLERRRSPTNGVLFLKKFKKHLVWNTNFKRSILVQHLLLQIPGSWSKTGLDPACGNNPSWVWPKTEWWGCPSDSALSQTRRNKMWGTPPSGQHHLLGLHTSVQLDFRETKVCQLDVTFVGNQHVVWLQVSNTIKLV